MNKLQPLLLSISQPVITSYGIIPSQLLCIFLLIIYFHLHTPICLFLQHKSFYSWIISSLVGFVYTFGFILMTPQLYINYKLKSVAHMPWKAMVYKALNTFIDGTSFIKYSRIICISFLSFYVYIALLYVNLNVLCNYHSI